VCNDRFDHDAFYVVGKSMGKIRDIADADQPPEGSVHAYVAKVDLKTLGATWLKHFTMTVPGGGKVEAEALACAVTPDSNGQNIVYVGGTIKDGASLDSQTGPEPAFGKDDIFLASMNGATGDVNWIQQMGTSENDRLATGQGLDVDSFGNAIVFAETGGDFYNIHEGSSDAPDLVILSVNKKDGTYLTPRTEGEGVGVDNPDDIMYDDDEDKAVGIPIPPDSIVAIQTNYGNIPSYAGGMYYDQYTNAVYLTGASYTADNLTLGKTSRCIFGIIALPQLRWKQKETFGTNKAPEACSAISLANYNGRSEVIMVGSSEKSGLFDDLQTNGRVKQYGMVLDLAHKGGKYDFIGGTVVDADKVQFPVQVVTDNEKVFVVSMASKSDEVRPDFGKADSEKFPNLTTGGIEKYGSQYEILVERHTLNHDMHDQDMNPDSYSTMDLDWRKPLETADQKSIFVSGMAMIDGGRALVVVGTTKGTKSGDDFDGIMAKVSTENGSFASEGDEARSVAYFSSVSGSDDWIYNVCNDLDDGRYFYITGATGGQMDDSVSKPDADGTVHAVVSKIQTDNLDIIWTTQYEVTHASGTAASAAYGCAAVPGKGQLYVAGDVESGAVLEGSTGSAGGVDIFVAMLDTSNGDKMWTKQIGSEGDDRIARGGGIATDANGNAVVYGDTTGNFHRIKDAGSSQTSDLFLMVFNHDDGAHEPPLSSNQSSIESDSTKKPKSLGIGIGVSLFFVVILICGCFFMQHQTRKKSDMKKKNSIFTYLQKFAVEDIDLRKSPPGGWHGTYLNKLAHGVNVNTAASVQEVYQDEHEEDEDDQVLFDSAKLVHSSIVKDSLFTENGSAPTLGSSGYQDDPFGGDDDMLTTRENSEKKTAKFSIV